MAIPPIGFIEEDLKNNYSYTNESYSTALRTKIYASMEYIVDHNNCNKIVFSLDPNLILIFSFF